MKINITLLFISLQLLFSLSFAFAEPNNMEEDCKLSCDQIYKSITTTQYREARRKFIYILLRNHEQISGSSEEGASTYTFYEDNLKTTESQQNCELSTLARCVMAEKFETLYQQQADTLGKEIIRVWDKTEQGGLERLMLYFDSAIEAIHILQPHNTYKAPKNITALNDNNQITHFIIRRMLKKLDPALVNKYLFSMKDLKHRVALQYKNKHSLKKSPYDSIEAVVEEIVKATNAHDYETMVKLLDEEFYDMQLNEIHEGDKTRFSNEFFCGDLNKKYTCMVFNEIKSIKKKRIEKKASVDTKVIFEVTNKKGETIQTSNVWIKATPINDHLTTYRMYGPSG